ncbi:hypothetical protein ANCCAN_14557 [Ancylostoma caninum]|uniref:Uncharacterized protein n=1 Tax=Ancylostoma caninum TaxID=29170 RepID=A0A368G8A8_ANCCA|nr:hypothetical protein ANCCAN_14557 [Ancylostoma caninum]
MAGSSSENSTMAIFTDFPRDFEDCSREISEIISYSSRYESSMVYQKSSKGSPENEDIPSQFRELRTCKLCSHMDPLFQKMLLK